MKFPFVLPGLIGVTIAADPRAPDHNRDSLFLYGPLYWLLCDNPCDVSTEDDGYGLVFCEDFVPKGACSCEYEYDNYDTKCYELYHSSTASSEAEVDASLSCDFPTYCHNITCSGGSKGNFCSGCEDDYCVTVSSAEYLLGDYVQQVSQTIEQNSSSGSGGVTTIELSYVRDSYGLNECALALDGVPCSSCSMDGSTCDVSVDCTGVAGIDEVLAFQGWCTDSWHGLGTPTFNKSLPFDKSHPLYGMTMEAKNICGAL